MVAIESVTLGLAWALGIVLRQPWWGQLCIFRAAWLGLLAGCVTSAASLSILLWTRRHGFPHAAEYVDVYFVPAAQTLGATDIVGLSMCSGFAEEALFRGVLQPSIGIWTTSLIFGMLHTGARDLVVAGASAAAGSLILGLLYQASGSLWCPIMCHAAHNLATLLYLRGPYLRHARPE